LPRVECKYCRETDEKQPGSAFPKALYQRNRLQVVEGVAVFSGLSTIYGAENGTFVV
jgi:hypothetical protein